MVREIRKIVPEFTKVFFDCDSTLITVEACDLLAEYCGVGEEVRQMTEASMNGEIPVEQVAARKVELIKPSRELVDRVANECVELITPGAKEFVAALLEKKIEVFIISGGYLPIVSRVAKELGVERSKVYGVELYFKSDGSFSHMNRDSLLLRQDGKARVVARLISSGGRTAFIGDGSTDAVTKGVVDVFIGYGGVCERQKVKETADFYCADKSLTALIPKLLS